MRHLFLAAAALAACLAPTVGLAQTKPVITVCRIDKTFPGGISATLSLFNDGKGGAIANVSVKATEIEVVTKGLELRPGGDLWATFGLALDNGVWRPSGSGGLNSKSVVFVAGTQQQVSNFDHQYRAGTFSARRPVMMFYTPTNGFGPGMAHENMPGLLQAAEKSGVIESVATASGAPAQVITSRIQTPGIWTAAETMRKLWPVAEKARVEGRCRLL